MYHRGPFYGRCYSSLTLTISRAQSSDCWQCGAYDSSTVLLTLRNSAAVLDMTVILGHLVILVHTGYIAIVMQC